MASSISKSSRSLVFENKVWNPAVQPRLHGTSSTGGGAAYHSPSLPDGHPISQGPPSNRKNWRSKEACQESSIEEGEAAEHAEWLAGSPTTSWKVFSRTRRGRKLQTEGCEHLEAQIIGPPLQQPNSQQQQQILSPREQRLMVQEEEGARGQHNTDHKGETLDQHAVEETGSANCCGNLYDGVQNGAHHLAGA
ncbi:hypothetical protein JHK82_048508 [Glycine max]|nr:hypothetical protein JHK85_049001 [Glycine max]KAG5098654.1 hypothetical protein JHK82_048508 [Glycine max]KAG5103425.1 hypothetical protein JHK84_048394 [Glycine max]